MTSSLEEALDLLNKWKADKCTLRCMFAAAEGCLNSLGAVGDLSGSKVQILWDRGEFLADLEAASFEYSDPREARDRARAEVEYGAALTVSFPSGDKLSIIELR